MGYAFISYSTKNQKDADTLRGILLKNRVRTWMAPYDIPAGSKYAAQLTKAVRECACFVLILTNASQSSAAVDREVEMGALSFQRPLVVIQTEPLELNDSFFFYLHNQQIVMVPEMSESTPEMKKVLDAIIKKTGQEGGTQPSSKGTAFDEFFESVFGSPKPESSAAQAAEPKIPDDPEECFLMGQKAHSRDSYEEAARFYLNAAEKGHIGAMLRLAELYYYGNGVKKSSEEMAKWYLVAAQKGDPEAQFQIANYYHDIKRHNEALYWFHRAAEQEYTMAYSFLGAFYFEGTAVEKDLETALMWYKKSADSHDDLSEMSKMQMGLTLRVLTNTANTAYNQKNYSEAVRNYRIGVRYGHAEAQHGLANCYFYGNGVPKDIDEAVRLDMLAASQGLAAAENTMGYYYNNGTGVSQNKQKALEWFQKAAQQGHARGQYNLGKLYYDGAGIPKNYEEAVKWFRKAADQNYVLAQYALGICFEYGYGVAKNLNEALIWYEKAAAAGNSHAKDRMLRCREAVKKAPAASRSDPAPQGPYIYISYSHKDWGAAQPIIAALQDQGFQFWYDNGCLSGPDWDYTLTQLLSQCSCLMALVSGNSANSRFCNDELSFAITAGKPILVVYLEEVILSPGMRLQLSPVQAVFRYRYPDQRSFLSDLCSAPVLEPFRVAGTQRRKPTKDEAFGTGIATAAAQPSPDTAVDELFCDAVELVLEYGSVSTSLIQRKLYLGYSRAAKLVDQLHQYGIIEESQGIRPRKVLITRAQWEQMKHRFTENQ